MRVNYDKLWVILNERGMMKTELVRAAKISTFYCVEWGFA